ncbi:MAG TPA: FecR domain-containing protein [Burkholderiales bacterium]|nr:FecR domain-containing protein [Burkholderiales bacterium]
MSDSPVREEAARWFQRRVAGGLDASEERRFEAWLRADPVHAQEYRALERIWSRLDELPLQAGGFAPPRRPRAVAMRWAACASFAVVAAVAVAWAYRWHAAQPLFAVAYATGVAERARAALPDGSRIELGAQSRLRVTFYRDRRESALDAGEAYFIVARDVSRPYAVLSGVTTVRVTGTRFSVRRTDDATQVALDEGSIEVANAGGEPQKLVAPAAVRSDAGGLHVLAPADVERLTAWHRGQLVFHDEPLAEVARELSRYRRAPVHVADADAGALRVTGIAFLDRPDAFIDGLAAALPVALERGADGAVTVRAAP